MNIFECLSSYITSFHAYVWNLAVCPLVNSSQKSMKFSNDFEELFEVSAGFGVSFVFSFDESSRYRSNCPFRSFPFVFLYTDMSGMTDWQAVAFGVLVDMVKPQGWQCTKCWKQIRHFAMCAQSVGMSCYLMLFGVFTKGLSLAEIKRSDAGDFGSNSTAPTAPGIAGCPEPSPALSSDHASRGWGCG